MEDALVAPYSMFKVIWSNEEPKIIIRHLEEPSHCQVIEVEADNKLWFYDIKRYLKKEEYPENDLVVDKMTLRRLVADFFLSTEV